MAFVQWERHSTRHWGAARKGAGHQLFAGTWLGFFMPEAGTAPRGPKLRFFEALIWDHV